MTNANTNPNPSRRHLLVAGAVLAPVALAGAASAATGHSRDDDALRALFAEWEPISKAYKEAVSACDAAFDAARAETYQYTPEEKSAVRRLDLVSACRRIASERYPERAANELDFKAEAEIASEGVLKPGQTPEQWVAHYQAVREKREESEKAALTKHRVDEMEARLDEISDQEKAVIKRMAATPAQSLTGVGLKIHVLDRFELPALKMSIATDVRRLAGLPALDGAYDPLGANPLDSSKENIHEPA